ncbi:MAG: PA14 domain-containing protein [Chloroflexota bacterium]
MLINNKRIPKIATPIALIGMLLFVLTAMGTERAQAQGTPWRARYFNNRNLSGEPVVRRDEGAIDYDWGGGSPIPTVVNDDDFSVRWTRDVDLTAGTYRFTATMDDGMRVWINDQLVIDEWKDSQVRTVTADRSLPAGRHTIRVEYYEAGGMAVARFSFSQISTTAPSTFTFWKGEYFNNRNLSGAPVLTRDDAAINFDWGTGSPAPGIPADGFSVRWTRTLNYPAGTYRFDVFSDDGIRLWVNNQLVIDQWRDQSDGRFSANVNLPGGPVPLQVQYYENVGRAAVNVTLPPGGTPLTGATPVATPPPSVSTNPWRGEYFNNRDLTGAPALIRNDAAINFNWGSGSPAPSINADNFSVRWTRTVNLPAGNYRFDVFSDDGVRLWVNNQILIDQWRDQSDGRFSANVNLPGGTTTIRLDYYEAFGRAAISLSATPPLPAGTTTGTAPSPTPGVPSATMTGALYLNVRDAPSMTGNIITVLRQGQTVRLTGFQSVGGYWIEIFLPDGQTGWVSARYMTGNVPFSTLPVKVP